MFLWPCCDQTRAQRAGSRRGRAIARTSLSRHWDQRCQAWLARRPTLRTRVQAQDRVGRVPSARRQRSGRDERRDERRARPGVPAALHCALHSEAPRAVLPRYRSRAAVPFCCVSLCIAPCATVPCDSSGCYSRRRYGTSRFAQWVCLIAGDCPAPRASSCSAPHPSPHLYSCSIRARRCVRCPNKRMQRREKRGFDCASAARH